MNETETKKVPLTDEEEIKIKCAGFIQDALNNIQETHDRGRTNRGFYRGGQGHWTEKEWKAMMNKGVTPLTINHCLPIINTLAGTQRQNKQDFRVRPRRSGSEAVATVYSELLKHTMDVEYGDFKTSNCFTQGIINMTDYLKLDVDWTDTPGGAMKLDRRPMFNVLVDPTNKEYDVNKGKFVIDQEWKDKDIIDKTYPDKKDSLGASGSIAEEDPNGLLSYLTDNSAYDDEDPEVDTVKRKYKYFIQEIRWKEFDVHWVWTDKETKQTMILKKKAEVAKAKSSVKHMPERFRLDHKVVTTVHQSFMCGGVLLEDRVNPWGEVEGLLMYRFTPYWDEGYEFGVIDNLISPQREENINRTQATRLMNQTANAGWIVRSVDKIYKAFLEKFGSTPGMIVEEDKCGGKAVRLEPNQLSRGHFELSRMSSVDLKEISSVNDALQGYETGRSDSGRALQLKQRQGMTASEIIRDNFNWTLTLLGNTMVEIIQKLGVYTDDEIRSIISASKLVTDELLAEAAKDFALSPREPMIPVAPDRYKMQQLPPQYQEVVMDAQSQAIQGEREYAQNVYPEVAREWRNVLTRHAEEKLFGQMRADKTGKYSVKVTLSQSSPTARMATLTELSEIGQQYPGSIPVEIFIEATDLPNKDEIKAKIQQNQAMQQQVAMQGAA